MLKPLIKKRYILIFIIQPFDDPKIAVCGSIVKSPECHKLFQSSLVIGWRRPVTWDVLQYYLKIATYPMRLAGYQIQAYIQGTSNFHDYRQTVAVNELALDTTYCYTHTVYSFL